MTESVLRGCRRCGSPFLHACAAWGVARCRSCGWVHVLGRGEVLPEVEVVSPVTTITRRDDLPAGMVLVTRMTPRLVCQRIARARDVEAVG